jgi:protein-S-isoprenylcysteine O-methyltransferase Ste14
MARGLTRAIVFAVATLLLAWVSRNQLTRPDSHGFYRFGAWELLLFHWIVLKPYGTRGWLISPQSPLHVVAWLLLGCAVTVTLWPAYLLWRRGEARGGRDDSLLFPFEKTTQLVTGNVYAYIRHPMYAGLLLATWCVLVQKCSWLGALLTVLATACIVSAVRAEEAENLRYFGAAYESYMRRSKRFIPWLL